MLVAKSGCGVEVGSGVEDGSEVVVGVNVAAGWADGPHAEKNNIDKGTR